MARTRAPATPAAGGRAKPAGGGKPAGGTASKGGTRARTQADPSTKADRGRGRKGAKAAAPSSSRRDGDGARPAARRPRAERPTWPDDGSRGLFPAPDTSRPHVRLGLLWFVVVVVALVAAPLGLVVPYGLASALGAAQTARAWRRVGRRPAVPVAAAAALALPLGAALAWWGLGAAILLGIAVTVLLTPGDVPTLLAEAATTVRSWLFAGLAAASVVVVADIDLGAGVALVALTSIYDCGNYLVGADSRWPWLGVGAGILAIGVVTFSLFVLALQPFEGHGVLTYGVATAVLAPLGTVAASWVLPDGRALASGLRRLDSVLLVGPAWLVLFAVAPPG